MIRTMSLALGLMLVLSASAAAESRQAAEGEKQVVVQQAEFGGSRAIAEFFKTLKGYVVFDERLDLVDKLGRDPVAGARKQLSVIYRCEPGGGMKAHLTEEEETVDANGRRMTHVLLDCR